MIASVNTRTHCVGLRAVVIPNIGYKQSTSQVSRNCKLKRMFHDILNIWCYAYIIMGFVRVVIL